VRGREVTAWRSDQRPDPERLGQQEQAGEGDVHLAAVLPWALPVAGSLTVYLPPELEDAERVSPQDAVRDVRVVLVGADGSLDGISRARPGLT
jgi:hypothetical protein